MRLLALHFTSPSSSEAKVAAALAHSPRPGDRVHVVAQWPAVTTSVPSPPWPRRPLSRRSTSGCRSIRPSARAPNASSPGPTTSSGTSPSRSLGEGPAGRRVHTSQQRFDCVVGELISRVLRVPQVVHLHYTPGPELRWWTMRRLRTCDRVLAVSAFIAELAEQNGVSRVASSCCRTPSRTWPPLRPRRRLATSMSTRTSASAAVVVGQCGRMEAGKGFADTLGVRCGARPPRRRPPRTDR